MRHGSFFGGQRYTLSQQLLNNFPSQNILLTLDQDQGMTDYANAQGIPNWTLPMWDAYVTGSVQSYPNVHVWEAGDEVHAYLNQYPNGNSSGVGYFQKNGVTGYVQMMKDVWNIIRSTPGHANDIINAFGGIGVFVPLDAEVNAWNADMWSSDPLCRVAANVWAAGGGNYCNAFSAHPYPHDLWDGRSFTNPITAQSFYNLNDVPLSYPSGIVCKYTVKQVMQHILSTMQNITNMPVYFTETGMPATGGTNNSLAKQAQWASDIIPFLSAFSPKMILWWLMISYPNVVFGTDFGLWDYTMTPPAPRHALSVFGTFMPQISVSPNSIIEGQNFTLSGIDFTPNASSTIIITPDGNGVQLGPMMDGNGAFSAILPGLFVVSTPTQETITVTDAFGHSASTTLVVNPVSTGPLPTMLSLTVSAV